MKRKQKSKKPTPAQPKEHLHRVRMRAIREEAGQVNEGAKDAKKIETEFNRLSEFKLVSIGTEATTGYVEGLIPSSPNLDFGVYYKAKLIAQVDVTGSNYTLKGSRIMPIHIYKGVKIQKLSVPTFIIFWMKKELGAIKDCCYWIKGNDVIMSPTDTVNTQYKPILNYMTDKADWHKGLESLIEELEQFIFETA